MLNLVSIFGFILLSLGLAVVLSASINEAPIGVLAILAGLCLIIGKFISPKRGARRSRAKPERKPKQ
ncbi:MAG TPA: hypothetical protein VGV59_03600 [Pyrinomonadaceae bacterium]|nr:hypothetical protein [Pyrinomonadaceae bacterium]